MVFTSTLCALNLVSSCMVNGLCSFYQMQEEERRMKQQQEAIQNSIREEYDRNCRMSQTKQTGIYSSCVQAERRRKLMIQKMLSKKQDQTAETRSLVQSTSILREEPSEKRQDPSTDYCQNHQRRISKEENDELIKDISRRKHARVVPIRSLCDDLCTDDGSSIFVDVEIE